MPSDFRQLLESLKYQWVRIYVNKSCWYDGELIDLHDSYITLSCSESSSITNNSYISVKNPDFMRVFIPVDKIKNVSVYPNISYTSLFSRKTATYNDRAQEAAFKNMHALVGELKNPTELPGGFIE